uniref:ABC transporter domain-containing protein n=1 Tax=Anopheles atroparvus TaxID=41427 RepID=A0A182IM77_ANOAO
MSSLVWRFALKSLTEKKRHFFRNFFITFAPFVFLIAITNVPQHQQTQYDDGRVGTIYEDDLADELPGEIINKVYYTPKTSLTETIIEEMRMKLYMQDERIVPFNNERDLEYELLDNKHICYGIIFQNISDDGQLRYTLRMRNNNFRSDETYSRDVFNVYKKRDDEYVSSGFLAIQNAIDRAFLSYLANRTNNGERKMEHVSMRYGHIPVDQSRGPRDPSNAFYTIIWCVASATFASVYLLLLLLVEERACGVNEHLKIACSSSYWNEVTLFFISFIQFFFVFFISFIYCLSYGLWETSLAEAYDLYTSVYPSVDGLSLSSVYLLQILGIFLWTFLWFYVTNVFPGRYGTPKSKCFFLSINYWRRVRGVMTGANGMRQTNRVMAESRRELQQREPNGSDPDYAGDTISLEMAVPERIEELAPGNHAEPLVRITKLNKVFKGRWSAARSKMAVKDLSISIYSHNITVLLGHNGAGKTTTMNIITGMVPRTSGSIVVDGEYDPNRYRQRIGFCPQHNVFYSYLNCREHLEFYGRLRGLSAEEAEKEAEVVLQKVNLVDKSKHFVHTLSGGMKRRLSLAIAIIGHTKVLILDEPTSGLDPESRRDIWDLLLKLRKDHTILLTTHFMEEADILGDWIAIMEHGELVAFGTPLFLKQVYGKGYTLKLQKGSPGFDTNKAFELIRQYVPNATVRDSVQEVFAVTLPYDSLDQYPSLLGTLEAQQHDLAIDAISMTNASLEEVFLNSSKSNKVMQHHQESEDRVDSPFRMPPTSSIMLKKPTSIFSLATLNTCQAIWRKKFIHMQCNKHIYGSLLSLPLIVTMVCFWITTGHTDVATALPAVTLNSLNIRRALGMIVINRTPEDGTVPSSFSKEAILSGTYPTLIGMELLVVENVSLAEAMQELIEKDYTAYRDRVVVGIECNASMERLEMTVLHNNNLVHSTGIGESIATTLLLRYYLGLPEAMIEVQNIPSTRRLLIDIGTPYYFTELVSIAFMFYILIFMQVPLLEHQTGFRQLQNVNRYIYWGSTYVFDGVIHILLCVLVIILAMNLDRKDAFSSPMYAHICCALLLYGLQALLVVYIISMCVQNSNTAITIMSYLLIIGVGGVFLLSSGYDDIKNNSFWIGLLHLVPEFALKHSMRVIYENQKLIVYENHSTTNVDYDGQKLSLHKLYAVPVIVIPLLVLILNEVVENIHRREKFSLVHYLIQSYTRRIYRAVLTCGSLRHRNRNEHSGTELQGVGGTSTQSGDETDGGLMSYVQEESETVENLLGGRSTQDEREKYAIVVNKLQKAYYDEHDAVKRISFAVKKGECFGLLGMNGAGKTTVFQMLSGNLPLSAGEIYLQHCEVQQANALEYREQYGYCPQIDMLLDFMTVYQTIDYFAQIKHIPARESHITHWLTVLDILAYRDHAVGECSGGTKRKVNTILALLGGPSVVLLDEPTTGVDPKSRRFLWKCIKAIQREDQTILLTSHSMDECEELCNRLSIMVAGSLRCIGSILQLKKRHGQDYTVLFKLSNAMMLEAPEKYESFIREATARLNATLREEHQGMVKFTVNPPFKLSELFELVNELKNARGDDIISYSINETSLEDIFMKFRPKTAEC